MQYDLFSASNGDLRSALETLQYQYQDSSSVISQRLQTAGGNLSYTPPPFTPSPLSHSTMWANGDEASENRLYLMRLALDYQEISERYELCLSRLQEATQEKVLLRRENMRLRRENDELTERLSMASKKQDIMSQFNRLRIGEEASPTSVLPLQPLNENQVLPRSISIRSRAFLKNNQTGPAQPTGQGLGPKKEFEGGRKSRIG